MYCGRRVAMERPGKAMAISRFIVKYDGFREIELGDSFSLKISIGDCRMRKPFLFLFVLLVLAKVAGAGEKEIIGETEHIVLLPSMQKLPARIDTGASMSSIDARDIEILGNEVRFRLPEKYGGHRFHLPVVYTIYFKNSNGGEERPLAVLDFCMGKKRFRAMLNLKNRQRLKYPFLIGRDVLMNNYVVDVARKYTLKSECRG